MSEESAPVSAPTEGNHVPEQNRQSPSDGGQAGAAGTTAKPSASEEAVSRAVVDPNTIKIQRRVSIYLALVGLVFLYLLYALWPRVVAVPASEGRNEAASTESAEVEPSSEPSGQTSQEPPLEGESEEHGTKEEWVKETSLFGLTGSIPDTVRIILLVLILGAVGSVVGAASSLAHFVGNRNFEPSWTLWYYLRPLIGSILALVFYLVIRAGFDESFATLTAEDLEEHLGLAAAIAALTGMFSKLTADKLEQIFATILQSDSDKHRADKTPTKEPSEDEPNANQAAGAGSE